MRAWISQHWQSLIQTLARLAAAPASMLANALVIGVVLALPLGAYGLLVNVQAFSGSLPTEPQMSLFLSMSGTKPDIASLESKLRSADGVRSVRFVSRNAALAGLKGAPGMGEVIGSLRENPLPDAFVVTLASASPESTERLEQSFKALPGVAHVQVDSAWIRRIDGLLRLGRTTVLILAVLLGFALVAVTFNTIRLQVLTRREEIEVSQLVGATEAYIRRPFFYFGALLGMTGALVGLSIVAAAFAWMNRDLRLLGQFYGINPSLSFFSTSDLAAIVFFSALLGWLGTYLSVSKHLQNPSRR
jgi:cell division transport system permease protein